MAKFATYETTRNALEESSVTKLFERASFALLGIKTEYNGKNFALIFHDYWKDIASQISFLFAALIFQFIVILKKNLILQEN